MPTEIDLQSVFLHTSETGRFPADHDIAQSELNLTFFGIDSRLSAYVA